MMFGEFEDLGVFVFVPSFGEDEVALREQVASLVKDVCGADPEELPMIAATNDIGTGIEPTVKHVVAGMLLRGVSRSTVLSTNGGAK